MPPLMLNSHETFICSTCPHCIRLIRILITGSENLLILTVLHAVFSFDQFLGGFAILDDFFTMVLWFLIDSNAPL